MHEALHAPLTGVEPLAQRGGGGGIVTRDFLVEVVARGERPSCSGQHDHPDGRIGIGLVERPMELPFEPVR